MYIASRDIQIAGVTITTGDDDIRTILIVIGVLLIVLLIFAIVNNIPR